MSHALALDTAAVPWWGVPLLAGLFALLGVAAAHISNFAQERARARRQLDANLKAGLSETSSRYLVACEIYVDESTAGDGRSVSRGDVMRLRTEVAFIAPGGVVAEAFELFRAASAVGKAYESGADFDSRHGAHIDFRFRQLRFTDSVRISLGLNEVASLVLPGGRLNISPAKIGDIFASNTEGSSTKNESTRSAQEAPVRQDQPKEEG